MIYKKEEISIRGEPYSLSSFLYLKTTNIFEKSGRNLGNLLYTYATAKILSFPKNKNWTDPLEEWEKILVYPLANQLGSHYKGDSMARFWNSLPEKIKIIGVGLGIQAPLGMSVEDFISKELNESHINFLKAIFDRAPSDYPNLTLRGEYTLKVLEELGFKNKAIVSGCPSFLLSPFSDLGIRIAKRFSEINPDTCVVHFTLGAPWIGTTNSFEKKGVRIAIRTGGRVHVQMDLKYIKFARWEELTELELELIAQELNFGKSDLREISKKYFSVWLDVLSWMEFLNQNADFVFGSRIHGIIAAIQAGVPALCVVVDSRTLELCKIHHIPHVILYQEPWISGNYTLVDLLREFEKQFDPIEFDKSRLGLLNLYKEFFEKNKISSEISLFFNNNNICSIKGHLDRIDVNDLFVSGWVFNPQCPEERLTVIVFVDNEIVGEGVANNFREDLKRANIGDGRYAFKIKLPESLADGKEHVISVKVKLYNVEVKNSPQKVIFNKR